jgi:hypothetical protein
MSTKPEITAQDYNNIYNQVAAILGPGSGSRGYGQVLQSSPVLGGGGQLENSNANVIRQSDWNNLRNDIISIKRHQDGIDPVIVPAVFGTPIGDSAGDPKTNYNNIIQQADLTRFNVGPSQFTISQLGSRTTTTPWSGSASVDITVTFLNNNDSRYFFNSGGKFRFTTNRTAGAPTSQNTAWTNILNSAGTQEFGAGIPQVINFYSLTDTPTIFYQLSASTPYSDNVYRILASCNVADNSTGLANEVYFKVELVDGYVDPGNTVGDTPDTIDQVDGTLRFDISQLLSTGSLAPTGTFDVPSPDTISISSITLS